MCCEEIEERVRHLTETLRGLRADHEMLTGTPDPDEATGGLGFAGASAQLNEVRRAIQQVGRELTDARAALQQCRAAQAASGTALIGSGSVEVGSGTAPVKRP